ncbi:hypothetical protein FACS189426_14390 [Bacteroidia bacterium]|nr:hypothetical protein FACS189426_14390 [Bacteroidia bacterium]
MLLLPVLLFPQQQHRQDSIALIEEHYITDSNIYLDDSTKNQPNTTLAVLEFTTTAKTKYALDQYREIYAKVPEYFMKYKPTVSDMIASAKFMLPGESDEIFVKIKESKSDFDLSKVHFVTNNGKEYTGTYNSQDKGWTLNIVGSNAGDGQEIYVVYEESKGKFTTLDKLNVYSYERKSVNIKLVPVNGFTNSFNVNALSTELNKIYSRVGVTCNLSMAESGFTYTPVNGNSFDVTGSGLFSTETADMKAIKQAYSTYLGGNLDGNTLYLFIIEKITGADGVAGDMPRGKRFGYLFPGADARTIAHEIGHGAFNLEHPFDRPLRGEFDRGQLTHCLMDYTSGTEFCKLEWDAINAPGVVIGVLETDEGGMYPYENYMVLDKDMIFFTPTANPLFLPKDTKIYSPIIDYRFLPNWPVYIFETPAGKYIASINSQTANPIFYGYRKEDAKNEYYNESFNRPNAGQSVTVTLVKHRSEEKYDILTLNESEQPYLIKSPTSDNKIPITEPNVGSVKKVDESKKLNPYAAIGGTDTDWNTLKAGLDNLNKKLNGAWSVSVIDKDGQVNSLTTGSKGTVTYQYDKTNKKWIADIAGISDNEVKQIITDAINKKLDAFQIDENGNSKIDKTTVMPLTTEDGGEFRFGDGLHWYEWGSVLADAGTAIYENAALPETYWKQDDAKYKDYPLHTAPTFAGVSDGVIDEVTSIPQLVKLGLEVATDKDKAQALWESVKNINLSSIKEAATGAIKEKWDKYANSLDYITFHELGKDGVMVASMIYGGFAAKGKKLSEAVEESGDIIENQALKKIEKILTKVDTYEQARNKAFETLGDLGADSKAIIGRLSSSKGYGKIVGRSSADGKKIWRVDYDPEKGMHINVIDYTKGKGIDAEKYVIQFNGNEQTFEIILNTFNR